MSEKVKPIRAVQKDKGDPDREALADSVRALIPRILAGEVIAIYGVLITEDPAEELSDESVELFEEGFHCDEGMAYAALSAMAQEVLESWRDDYMPRPEAPQ